MGTILASEIDTAARAILGAIDTALLPTAALLRHTNAAYQDDICLQYDLDELDATDSENCTAAQSHITFSVTDVLKVKGITISDTGLPLTITSADGFSRLLARSGDATGEPTHFYRTGASTSGTVKFNLYPTPTTTTTLILNYRKRPAALTDSTATAIDALFDQPIVYLAAARSAVYLRMYKDAEWLKKYGLELAHKAAVQLSIVPDETFIFWGEQVTGAMR